MTTTSKQILGYFLQLLLLGKILCGHAASEEDFLTPDDVDYFNPNPEPQEMDPNNMEQIMIRDLLKPWPNDKGPFVFLDESELPETEGQQTEDSEALNKKYSSPKKRMRYYTRFPALKRQTERSKENIVCHHNICRKVSESKYKKLESQNAQNSLINCDDGKIVMDKGNFPKHLVKAPTLSSNCNFGLTGPKELELQIAPPENGVMDLDKYTADMIHLCQPKKLEILRFLKSLYHFRQGDELDLIEFCRRARQTSKVMTNIRFLGKK